MNTFYVTPELKLVRVEPTTGMGRITFQSFTSTAGELLVSQVAVTSTAVKLVGDNIDTSAEGVCFIDNRGTNEIYLGASDVTAATGYQLDAADAPLGPIPLGRAAEIWARCAAAETATVHVLVLGA